ncbi:hypothetical protein [Glaciihabitans sp. dw_435]|uniref:hypothetical protein n=1 Tax=Glaciihabitans sp. dw_435 TaxID=2720081 RepID=UPI001BD553BD|nr:hypothetical protein [Glaciihabitans sp. dw_435]
MSKDPEDDALSWGDESDPTHIEAPEPAVPRSTPAERRAARRAAIAAEDAAVAARTPGATIDTAGSGHDHHAHGTAATSAGKPAGESTDPTDRDTDADDDLDLDTVDEDDESDTAAAPMNSFVLLVIGILSGVYLLYTIGWVVTLQRATDILPSALDQFMAQLRLYLAIVAPAAWLGAALLLTRGRRSVVRILALLLGALVLVPWSFVLGA